MEELEKKLKELKEQLNKADPITAPSTRKPVNALGVGWSQDPGTGAFHHSTHGVISTSKHPDGYFSITHGGRPVGRTNTIEEAGAKIKNYVNSLQPLDTGMHSGDPMAMKSEDGMEKSGYGPKGGKQYNPADNAKRKANNVGDRVEGIGQNANVKSYSTKPGQLSAKAQATVEAARAKKLSGPVKHYTPEEIEEYKKKKALEKSQPEWSEDELARRLSGIIPFGQKYQPQPTDEQMFGHLVVTPEQQATMENQYQGKFGNFFSEVQKPLSQLKKFATEEEELAYWSSLGTSGSRDDGSSGY